MTSWENELQNSVNSNNLASVKAIVARAEVRKTLGRKEWLDDSATEIPFHHAAYLGRDEMVQAMAEAGVDVNSYWNHQAGSRMTSLHYVSGWGCSAAATAKLLLDLGADPSLLGEWVDPPNDSCALGTALDWARERGNKEVVRILEDHAAKLEEPANPTCVDSFETLDFVAKLTQKSLKIKEAYRIQTKILEKTAKKKKLEEEIADVKEQLKTLDEDLDGVNKDLKELKTIGESLKDVLEKEDLEET